MSDLTSADRIMQSVRARVPGVPDNTLTLELFNAIDEFLRRTMAWKELNPIMLFTDRTEYDLGVPAGSTIVRIMSVTHNGIPIAAGSMGGGISQSSLGTLIPELTFPDGDAQFAPVESDIDPGGIFSYVIYRPDFLTTTVAPTTEQTQFPLMVAIALSISEESLLLDAGDWQLPEWMYQMFFQDWLDGACFKLFSMPNKPWSNEKLTLYHGKRWRSAMAQRKQEAMRGFTFNKPMWRFPTMGGWTR